MWDEPTDLLNFGAYLDQAASGTEAPKRPTLTGRLTGIRMTQLHLEGASFKDVVLEDCTLDNCNLWITSWRNCRLQNTQLVHCFSAGMNFEDCTLDDLHINDCTFLNTRVDGQSRFTSCRMKKSFVELHLSKRLTPRTMESLRAESSTLELAGAVSSASISVAKMMGGTLRFRGGIPRIDDTWFDNVRVVTSEPKAFALEGWRWCGQDSYLHSIDTKGRYSEATVVGLVRGVVRGGQGALELDLGGPAGDTRQDTLRISMGRWNTDTHEAEKPTFEQEVAIKRLPQTVRLPVQGDDWWYIHAGGRSLGELFVATDHVKEFGVAIPLDGSRSTTAGLAA